MPREGSRIGGALSGDASPVRKARLPKNKRQLAEEAARVIHQADTLDCVSKDHGVLPERFYTLPTRKSRKTQQPLRRNSADLVTKKSNNLFGLFAKKQQPQEGRRVKRSVSDATNLKSKAPGVDRDAPFRKRSGSHGEDHKKQLSPIIENSPKEDFFGGDNKENINRENLGDVSVTKDLKKFIEEIDNKLFEETGLRPAKEVEKKEPEVVIIDLEKAEKIAPKNKKNKFNSLGKKIKSFTTKTKPPTTIEKTIQSIQNPKNSPKMIHSSQQPPEKLPLTRGRTVNHLVKRLSNDSGSPPPKTNVMITPNVSVQHNNNQPFSYTRGLSPDKGANPPGSPIIYAQVVCTNGSTPSKQTVHTAYMNGKKHVPHSDSDEGLGYEESSFNRGGNTTVTHFGGSPELYQYEEETPIKPSFKKGSYGGYNGYNKYEYTSRTEHFVDSSSRGRGDGMDAKRRESLTESPESNGFGGFLNGRSDLSARRDLLESRINNRRFGEKYLRSSPDNKNVPSTNIYVSEVTSKYYRGGSASPVNYKEKYVSETKIGDKYRKKYEIERKDYEDEPKSFDSHISGDYRSSPENRHFLTGYDYRSPQFSKYRPKPDNLSKKPSYYKSNPEIFQKPSYDSDRFHQESYHDSLRRERHENTTSSKKYSYFDQQTECDRKDKFGDSGIENDFRRDSGENFRYNGKPRREYCNDSEDEGFASSLLIASERQHTEDNFNGRKNQYDSERSFRRNEKDPYGDVEKMDYRSKYEYAHRERSIDDGSHYDPRIDKDGGTLKRYLEKKPPKPEKKGSFEKVKQLFSRDKKKKEKVTASREELSKSRYEYRGSRENLESPVKREHTSYEFANRRRSSSPSPSPTRDLQRNGESETTATHHNTSWFKSLDRLSRKKQKKHENGNVTNPEDDPPTPKQPPTKSLRFFGDTDAESGDSVRYKTTAPPRKRNGFYQSQSTRDLHNITEEPRTKSTIHKSMLDVSEQPRASSQRTNLKPPVSPAHRTATREGSRSREDRTTPRRRKPDFSSVESSEGDSSQQSQRSVVYLHAATVGDIPGPGYLRNGRRAASREELASNSSMQIQPQVKTLSRSFSVLAPWRPRHYREAMDIDYTQYPRKNGKYEQKTSKNGNGRKESTSTLKKKAQETRRSNQNVSTLGNRKSRSKENLSTLKRSREEPSKGSSSTLYKKKERQVNGNSRYNRDREEKRVTSKSMEYLNGSGKGRDMSRSVSMPRDPEKSAGWFRGKDKKSMSTQRL